MDVAHAPHELDAETRAEERPEDHREEVRLWLRLLTCTTLIEGEIRRRLRESFGVTLPRFDLMAQLEKAPDGLTLSDVSRRMMVSNGNLTGLVERLVDAGQIERRMSERDRRVQILKLTPVGRADFGAMARAHEGWVADMFAGLGEAGTRDLMDLLGQAKLAVRDAADRRRP